MRCLTFHHLHVLQRKLPQELVFTGGIDHTRSRVSERAVGEEQE